MQIATPRIGLACGLMLALISFGCASGGVAIQKPPGPKLSSRPIDPAHWQALAAANSAEAPFCSLDRHPLRAISPQFFGISAKEIHWDTPQIDLVAERIRQAGAHFVGTKVHWEVLEEQPGVLRWERYDPQIEAYGRQGLRPVVTLRGTAPWASSGDGGPQARRFPPRDLGDWRRFVRAAVKRWGSGGSGIVRDWEIWNEPNLVSSFAGSPEQYLQLLEAARQVIHRHDPEARVWAPALLFHPWIDNADTWLEEVVTKGRFDVLSIHLYFNDLVPMRQIVRRARRLLDESGKTTVPLAVSEVHVIDAVTRCPRLGAMAEVVHTQIVNDLVICLANAGVDHLLYFKATDLNFNCRPPEDHLPNRIGLLDENLQPKGRWYRFRDLAQQSDPAVPLWVDWPTDSEALIFEDGFESGSTKGWSQQTDGRQ